MEAMEMLAFYVAMLDTEEQKDKFTEIYSTYYGMMYQVARTITHDDRLAEDALHETFLSLIRDIDIVRTDNPKQLAYYLRMITRNRSVDFMRKWDRRSATSLEDLEFDLPRDDKTPEDIFLTNEKLADALQSLYSMPPSYRTALIMQVQGYSIHEIACITRSKEATVKTRIHRARKILMARLDRSE